MTRILRDADVRAVAGYPEAVDTVARGVVAAEHDGAAAERSTVRLGDGGWLRIMSGALPSEDVLGYKVFHLVPGAGVRYVCALYRLSTGEPLALIDANHLTVVRTSAAAAAAAARRWGDRPIAVAVIGTGTYARDGLRALAAVCRLRAVRAFSPRAERREAFARSLGGELEVAVLAVDEPAKATEGADMALCATVTGGRVALGTSDLGDARYVSSIGSTLPAQIELDPGVIVGAERLVLDTRDALEESGDLIAARADGLDESRVMLLADYLDAAPGRRGGVSEGASAQRGAAESTAPTGAAADGLMVYKSVGSVEQDLALAASLWRAAEERNQGEVVEEIELRRKPPGS